MKQKPLFCAILEDDSLFTGGSDFHDTKWKEINKKIKRIFYNLPSGDQLCISNKDRYYHYIEATTSFMGNSKGNEVIEFICIMGEKNDIVTVYKIWLIDKDKYKRGDLEVLKYTTNSEFVSSLNRNGWR